MKNPNRYKASASRRSDLVLRDEDRQQDNDDRKHVTAALSASQNAIDVSDCRWLIENPHAFDGVRVAAARFLKYLEANPTRYLAQGFRLSVDRMMRACRIRQSAAARGVPPPPPKPRKPRGPQWKRPPRPEWMNDPSLLPKRPPTKPEEP